MSFLLVPSKQETINGHTPKMLATTLSSPGMKGSPKMIALLKVVRDIVQSLSLAPFRRVAKNSIKELASRDLNMAEFNFRIQRFRRRKVKIGKSLSFLCFPMALNVEWISLEKLEPPLKKRNNGHCRVHKSDDLAQYAKLTGHNISKRLHHRHRNTEKEIVPGAQKSP